VDLVRVEAVVVDARGEPATEIPASHFRVTIDGRRREVLSAALMTYPRGGHTPGRLRTAGTVARNDWPAAVGSPAQTFVVAVDALSLSAGDGAAVARAALTFLEQLPPSDAVGFMMLPRGTVLQPTVDRQALRTALGGIVGLQATRSNPFHLTPAEVVDITAEAEMANLTSVSIAGRGGRAQVTTTSEVLRQVQTRECRGVDQACAQEIVMEAEALSRQLEEQVSDSLVGLRSLLTLLTDAPGRKTVVLLSAGMPVSDRPGGWHRDGNEARLLGRAAAVADATVYAIHIDAGYRNVYTSEGRSPRPAVSLARERDVQQRLLADFAEASGGALLSAPTDAGEAAFTRVLRETSAFYVLGVAPDRRDVDGRVHELCVSLPAPNVTVRHRRFVVLRPSR
jgi:VWFA-related protein